MVNRKIIQVESSYRHYGIVRIDLILDGEASKCVPYKGDTIVRAAQRLEERERCRKEWYILNVGVMFLHC